MPQAPLSVQFVCLGNICRSPAAQGVMEKLVRSAGLLDAISIDSAGTAGYHIGKTPDQRMIQAAANRGIALQSRAKQYIPRFAQERTLVLAMDADNLLDIQRVTAPSGLEPRSGTADVDALDPAATPHRNIRLFSDFLDNDWPRNVPDPYYGGDEGFEYVLDMLEVGCPRVLEHLKGMLAN